MDEKQKKELEEIGLLMRKWILTMTTKAGSGHPTSSMSSVELMSVLFFRGFFRYDTKNLESMYNDHLIFSKGHASPLYYALWAATGAIEAEELDTLRQFWSRLEGHPTKNFPFTDIATGALGQGLSAGLGMALAADRLDKVGTYTWVLLGDSEMAEGQVWEAMELAAHYKCHNLTAIIDVNRLGQRGETMLGHDTATYKKRAESFGWHAIEIDGHDVEAIEAAYKEAVNESERPTMIIAKTFKGKGISFLENHDNWHGKALSEEELATALKELGEVNEDIRGTVAQPVAYEKVIQPESGEKAGDVDKGAQQERDSDEEKKKNDPRAIYAAKDHVAVREAYGAGLVELMENNKRVVVLDAEVSNSTKSIKAKEVFPDRFFEMYIAEQNMVSVALGMTARGYVPYISSFAAFLATAYGQVRMAGVSGAQMVYIGTHPGVSIGADGGSQMGLEDMAFFRAQMGSVVLYPSDAMSTHALTVSAATLPGAVYLRATRESTPVLYGPEEEFPVGGSKVLCTSIDDRATIIAAGITVHEALLAYDMLKEDDIAVRVIDAYSIKPIDVKTIRAAAADTHAFVIVEDHYPEGGLGDAVRTALSGNAAEVTHLAVRKVPRSGETKELLAYEEIDAQAIVRAVRKMI